MKKFIFFALSAFLLLSCNQSADTQKYQYIEIQQEQTFLSQGEQVETEPVVVDAPNDTIAYMKAMELFVQSNKKNVDMIESGAEKFMTPLGFKLLDKDGKDITKTIEFNTKTQYENELFERFFPTE